MERIRRRNESDVSAIRKYDKRKHRAFFISTNIRMIPLIAFVLILSLVMPAFCADPESAKVKVYYNGDYRGSSAYIDADSGVGMVPVALINHRPGLRLNLRENQAWFSLNGRELRSTVGSNTYTIDGQAKTWRTGLQPWQYGIAVPGRDLFEALGASVRWDEKERAIYITAPEPEPTVPQNLGAASLPLMLALVQDQQLWLLDASDPKNQPRPVPERNVEQIIGWSHDGKWLAYLQRQSDDQFARDRDLWVVSSDGQRRQCLDTSPFGYSTPLWSPTENIIAYQAQTGNQDNYHDTVLRIAYQENGQWQCRELAQAADRSLAPGLAWFPDGQSLAISWTHDQNNLPALGRIDLQGKTSRLLVLPAALAGDYADGLYIQGINGLKISPDGRYAACFLAMNSASMNADGMNLQLIDLQQETWFPDAGYYGNYYPDGISIYWIQ